MKRMLLAALTAALLTPAAVTAYGEETAVRVEYDNLSQLLLEGCQGLKQANQNYETNLKNYEDMLETLQEERDYMRFKAKQYEDDEEAHATYSANANVLSSSAKRISDRIDAMKRRTQTITLEHNTDSYTMTAQSLMSSYDQMALNVTVSEKNVEAAEASYAATVQKQGVGGATAAEVSEAAARLEQERSLLTSYRQQADQLRFRFLSLLGLPDDGTVSIGKVPEPDLAAIDAVDYEADREQAVNNNDSVQSVRHTNTRTATERMEKSARETAAVGDAETQLFAAYQQLLTARQQYQAAQDAWQSAQITYQSLQLKKGAGMLNQTQYLQGEASYLRAQAQQETASMNLKQAYEDYLWQVKGITEAR